MSIRPSLLLASLLVLGWVAPVPSMEPQDRMQFADGMYVRGLYDMAAEEYAALRDESADYQKMDLVLFRLGECYRRLARTEEADIAYAAVGAAHPDSTYRHKADLRRSEMAVESGRYRDALKVLQSLVGRNPSPDIAAPAFYYLGYCRANLATADQQEDPARRIDAVEQPLRRVIERHPDSPFASFACLDLAAFYRETGRDTSEVRPLLEQALARPASDRVAAEALFQLAELSFADDDFEASAGYYGRLLEEHPADPRVDEARLQTAWSFFNVGSHQQALALASAGSQGVGATAPGWLYLLANCQRQLGDSGEAAATYDRLLALEPEGPHATAARYEQALLAFREGDFDKVVTQADTAPSDGKADEDFNWLLAESYMELKQPDKAQGRYLLVAKNNPAGARAPVATYRTAEIDQDAGRYAEASTVFRSVVERWPRHELAADALYASAYCRTRHGEDEEALRDWTALAADYPDYRRRQDVLNQKALSEWKLDRQAEAIETFDQLLESYPDTAYAAEAHRLAGVYAMTQGDVEGAEKRLRAALAAGADTQGAARIQYRLATLLQKQGKLDEAADLLQGLLPVLGSEMPVPLLEWLARHQAGREKHEEVAAAGTAMAAVAKQAAAKQVAWFLVGQAQLALGDKDESMTSLRKAAEVDASTKEGCLAALSLGDLALATGAYETAKASYEQAGVRAQTAERMEYRARSYYGLGRVAAAGEQWEDAVRYYMGVGILFDDPVLAPESLYRAAEAFGELGREADRAKTLKELKERYPAYTPSA